MRWLKNLLLAAVLSWAPAAGAAFHLWAMNELYSNPDGTIQFLEMTALTGGQQFLNGHRLVSSSGSVSRSITFDRNLPGDSGGRRMLIATQGFAALGIVTPDFVVPNGFFFPGGGSIDFASSSDVWSHGPTPSGALSLNRDGSTATNSPTNFAGQTGSITVTAPVPPLNVQGLWWRSPANSESGWGLNLIQQGDVLFATWFTYDTDGRGMWLVASDARSVGPNSYVGTLYRTTGPAFSSATWNSSQVVVTPVGSMSISFTDASNGTFVSTVNGVSQTKAITRQVYGASLPTCAPADSSGPSAGNFQDLWWRSPANSESGWGVNITQQGDVIFATWFTYGSDGRGMWLVMSDGRRTGGGNTFTGALYRTTGPAFSAAPWNPTQVNVTQAGTGTFTFTDASNGTFAYTVDGVSQSKSITRQVYGSPVTVCR